MQTPTTRNSSCNCVSVFYKSNGSFQVYLLICVDKLSKFKTAFFCYVFKTPSLEKQQSSHYRPNGNELRCYS